MGSKLSIDGIKLQVKEVEQETPVISSDVSNIVQPTELGDTLKELNKDTIEPNTRMSGIDMRARLHPFEISSVLALDALVSLRVLPTSCLAFTRQKKRLSVSLDGKGRDDIVNIVSGKKEMDAKLAGGMGDKMKGFFGMSQQPNIEK